MVRHADNPISIPHMCKVHSWYPRLAIAGMFLKVGLHPTHSPSPKPSKSHRPLKSHACCKSRINGNRHCDLAVACHIGPLTIVSVTGLCGPDLLLYRRLAPVVFNHIYKRCWTFYIFRFSSPETHSRFTSMIMKCYI